MATSGTDGLSSYRGYEFQKLVTVWLGLKLMCDEQRCTELTIEPASAEDVAANLKVPEGTATVEVTAEAIPVEIQIKSRGKNWSPAAFGDVIASNPTNGKGAGNRPGPAPRARAIDVLRAQPKQRFLLVTNAQIDTELKDFRVERIGDLSRAAELTAGAAKDVPADIVPRLGILPDMVSERVVLEIHQLLKTSGHVPNARLDCCRSQLMDDVHRRLLGQADRRWPRTRIIEVMRAAGGMPETESAIVPPTNFQGIQQQLETRHCVLLTGGPGLGKTEIARELVRLHRLQAEPFERIDGISIGVEGVRSALDAPGAHVFVFEDPWGSDRLADDARFWAKELPNLVRRASPEKRFVITSRVAIRREALGALPTGLGGIEITLESAHYSEGLRTEIVNRRMSDAAPWQRDWVRQHQSKWLRELTVPLSLDHFCSRIKRASPTDQLEIEDILRECGVDVLAHTCEQEVYGRGPDGIGACVAIWALHHARQQVGLDTAAEAAALVRAGGYALPIDPEKTFRWLVSAGWFRPAGDHFTAHPTCLTGISQFLSSEPACSDAVLQALLIGLVDRGRVDEAFRILRHLTERPTAVTSNVRQRIERFLVTEFLQSTTAAVEAMSNLVTYSTATDPVTVLLKALDARKPMPPHLSGFDLWRSSALSEDQKKAIRTSHEAEQAARVFVLHVLPEASAMRYNGAELVGFFREFWWDFSIEFHALCGAGLEAIRSAPNLDVFVAGALLSERPKFDEILDRCFTAIGAAEKEFDASREDRRAAEQSEVNADAASHLDDDNQELLALRFVILRDVVRLRRRKEGWSWIESHPRRDELLAPWAEGLDKSATDAEIEALIRICGTAHRAVVWRAIAEAQKVSMMGEIVGDLDTAELTDLPECIEQLARLVPLKHWPKFVTLFRQLPLARRAMLANADLFHADDQDAKRAALRDLFNPTEARAFELCVSANPNEQAAVVDAATREVLVTFATDVPDEFAAKAVLVLARAGEPIEKFLARLRASDNRRAREWALYAAVRARPQAIVTPADLRGALSDPEFRIRRAAMIALSNGADETSRRAILAMSTDRSAPVRETCAEIIGQHVWREGLPILAGLLSDKRDRNPSPGIFRGSRPDLHVARAAAHAIGRFSELDAPTVSACLDLLKESPSVGIHTPREDIEVHRDLLMALAPHDDVCLVSTFCALLDDDWYVEGEEHSGYPRRYAAAWALYNHLVDYPDHAERLDIESVVVAAAHDDGRLAAPCLLVLAGVAASAPEPLIRVCSNSISSERLVFALARVPDEATEPLTILRRQLGEHPALPFLDAADLPASPDAWMEWRAANPQFVAWLDGIRAPTDINPALRWLLGTMFPKDPPPEFKSDDLQKMLIPKALRSLTTWTMFHE